MVDNKNMTVSKNRKNDEFYTLYTDIEKELKCYADCFRGKTVYCNCDNLYKSQFFRYFVLHFNRLKLKKLICTCYANFDFADIQLSFFDGFQFPINREKAYRIEITKVSNDVIKTSDVQHLLRCTDGKVRKLKGNGDFRSAECIRLLKKSDIVVTNPPFSLFRDIFSILCQYQKDFLIIGNIAEVSCKEIFPHIKSGHVHFGYHAVKSFETPDNILQNFGNIYWYTTLHGNAEKKMFIPEKNFVSENYPHYDNFPAVHISKISEIPKNCPYFMGVPITYLLQHNPDLFEISGITSFKSCCLRNKEYHNAVIHKPDGTAENGSKCNNSAVICHSEKPDVTYYTADNANGFLTSVYARILIKSKS